MKENNQSSVGVANSSGDQAELKRVLKLPTLVCQGLAYLCPACILLYFGIINEMTGSHFVITLAITGVAMFLTALSYAKMSKKYTSAGSVYTYVGKTFKPTLGFIAGWSMLTDYILLPMVCYLSCGLYLNVMFPQVPIWIWIVITIVFCCVCNYCGVQVAALVNNINVILPVICIIITVVLIVMYVSDGGGTGTFISPETIYNPETFTFSGVVAGAAIMAFCFVGFDSVTTFAEETINPEKTMGKAVIIVCAGAAIEFVIFAYFLNLGWPTAVGEMQSPDTAITEYYVEIGAAWMNPVFVVMNTLACFGCIIAGQAATARILYNMGRDGFIPKKVFGYIHPKFKTPSRNILILAVIGLTAIIFQNSLANAMSLVSFGAMVGFIFTNLSVIVSYYFHDKKRGLKSTIIYFILPAIGIVVCVYLWFQLSKLALIIGFAWIALGVIFVAIKTKGFKELPPELVIDK